MPELSARSVVKHLTSNNAVWLGLLCASALLTAAYTCVTPFAPFAVIAAAALSRRDALLLMGALWLVNQTVGFAWLHYPWTATTSPFGLRGVWECLSLQRGSRAITGAITGRDAAFARNCTLGRKLRPHDCHWCTP